MNTKKLIALILALCLTASFAACGNTEQTSGTTSGNLSANNSDATSNDETVVANVPVESTEDGTEVGLTDGKLTEKTDIVGEAVDLIGNVESKFIFGMAKKAVDAAGNIIDAVAEGTETTGSGDLTSGGKSNPGLSSGKISLVGNKSATGVVSGILAETGKSSTNSNTGSVTGTGKKTETKAQSMTNVATGLLTNGKAPVAKVYTVGGDIYAGSMTATEKKLAADLRAYYENVLQTGSVTKLAEELDWFNTYYVYNHSSGHCTAEYANTISQIHIEYYNKFMAKLGVSSVAEANERLMQEQERKKQAEKDAANLKTAQGYGFSTYEALLAAANKIKNETGCSDASAYRLLRAQSNGYDTYEEYIAAENGYSSYEEYEAEQKRLKEQFATEAMIYGNTLMSDEKVQKMYGYSTYAEYKEAFNEYWRANKNSGKSSAELEAEFKAAHLTDEGKSNQQAVADQKKAASEKSSTWTGDAEKIEISDEAKKELEENTKKEAEYKAQREAEHAEHEARMAAADEREASGNCKTLDQLIAEYTSTEGKGVTAYWNETEWATWEAAFPTKTAWKKYYAAHFATTESSGSTTSGSTDTSTSTDSSTGTDTGTSTGTSTDTDTSGSGSTGTTETTTTPTETTTPSTETTTTTTPTETTTPGETTTPATETPAPASEVPASNETPAPSEETTAG